VSLLFPVGMGSAMAMEVFVGLEESDDAVLAIEEDEFAVEGTRSAPSVVVETEEVVDADEVMEVEAEVEVEVVEAEIEDDYISSGQATETSRENQQ